MSRLIGTTACKVGYKIQIFVKSIDSKTLNSINSFLNVWTSQINSNNLYWHSFVNFIDLEWQPKSHKTSTINRPVLITDQQVDFKSKSIGFSQIRVGFCSGMIVSGASCANILAMRVPHSNANPEVSDRKYKFNHYLNLHPLVRPVKQTCCIVV